MKTLEKLQSFPFSSWGPGLLSGPEFKSPVSIHVWVMPLCPDHTGMVSCCPVNHRHPHLRASLRVNQQCKVGVTLLPSMPVLLPLGQGRPDHHSDSAPAVYNPKCRCHRGVWRRSRCGAGKPQGTDDEGRGVLQAGKHAGVCCLGSFLWLFP